MISPQLQSKIQILEMAIFPKWQKADEKEREKITRELGEFEARMILEEIDNSYEKNTRTT